VEFFWTDICFLALILIGITWLLNALRKASTREACMALFQDPRAVSAGLLLLLFLLVGVLDSIHLTNKTSKSRSQAPTVLDNMLSPLGKVFEKTYSAPLALTSYTPMLKLVAGIPTTKYQRLKYPPTSLQTRADSLAFISSVVLRTLWISLGVLCVLLLFFRFMMKKRSLFQSNVMAAWLTITLCVFFVLCTYGLSRELHVLGTGKIGQDIFYMTVKSIRTGLIIGTLTTLFMLPLAIILGIAAGYFGGLIDDIIQYIYTTLSSIPGILLITASVLSMQTYIANHPEHFSNLAKSADARLLALCIILGVTSWTSLCRLLRAEALKLREIDFVLAAKAMGSSNFYIFHKHLLPNVMPIVLITLVLDFSFLVLAEAVLSYVGVGVSPLTISWGNMINGARLELASDPVVWWPMMSAFAFLFALVLASNLFADALREVLDPQNALN